MTVAHSKVRWSSKRPTPTETRGGSEKLFNYYAFHQHTERSTGGQGTVPIELSPLYTTVYTAGKNKTENSQVPNLRVKFVEQEG